MILQLDYSGDVPIYQQIRNQIVMGIASGAMQPGEKLPTIRTLAEEAGVNVMTVNKAYALLKSEGYILADRRMGAMVNPKRQNSGVLSEKARNWLRLAVSEAKLQGVSRAALIEACNQFYDEEKVV